MAQQSDGAGGESSGRARPPVSATGQRGCAELTPAVGGWRGKEERERDRTSDGVGPATGVSGVKSARLRPLLPSRSDRPGKPRRLEIWQAR